MTHFKMGVIIDPIHSLTPYKDSTIALMLEALNRSWEVYFFEMNALSIKAGQLEANGERLLSIDTSLLIPDVKQCDTDWYKSQPIACPLASLDVVLMRKDPPYTMSYHFTTQMLRMLANQGTLVSNAPRALREYNEKLFALEFPDCIAPTLVGSKLGLIQQFAKNHGDIVLKPLDAMGGQGIFKIDSRRTNLPVAVELLTQGGQLPIMAQKFLPEISAGDKRVLMINGEPIPYVLARVPQGEDIRGNLAAGGKGIVQPLTDADRKICDIIGPSLREKGIHLAGLDIIGEHVTEINITSPTCIREIASETGLNIAGQLLDTLAQEAQALKAHELP